MIENLGQALATVVPAVWGFGAIYLVWGTQRSAPLTYPFLMGSVGCLTYLSLNEIPIWFPGGVTEELIGVGLLLAAVALAFEVLGHTIRYYDLGHRSKVVQRTLAVIEAYFVKAARLDSRDDPEPPATRWSTKAAALLGRFGLYLNVLDRKKDDVHHPADEAGETDRDDHEDAP